MDICTYNKGFYDAKKVEDEKKKELKEAFKEWNKNSDGFPSERLLTAINKMIK